MRLVGKLAAALVLSMTAVLSAYLVFAVQRERDLLEAEVRRSERIVGQALAKVVEEAWRRAGEDEARRTIEMLDLRDEEVEVELVRLSEGDQAVGEGQLWASEVVVGASGEPRLVSYFRVSPELQADAAIMVSESLEPQLAAVDATAFWAVTTVSVAVGLTGVLSLMLGAVIVGRPVRAIVDKARRVGSGDFSGPLTLARKDELGHIGDEIDAMADRLRSAKEALEEETQARIHTLEQLRHADRLTTVGKLASGIAHELGTPLNVVLGRAKMIVKADADPSSVENARIVADQARRMTHIIRQLLDFARRRTANKKPHSLSEVARTTAALLSPLAKKKGVEIAVEARDEVPVDVDSSQLQQALTNLVMNAVHAMPNGGNLVLRIGARQITPPPDVGGDREKFAMVEVIDTGVGMEPGVAARVFEPFFTTKEVGEGTGLGLSVSYGIARDHGGFIDVASVPGEGSTFTLFLPLEGENVGPEAASAAARGDDRV